MHSITQQQMLCMICCCCRPCRLATTAASIAVYETIKCLGIIVCFLQAMSTEKEKRTWVAAWNLCALGPVEEIARKIEKLEQVTGAVNGRVLSPKDCSLQESLAQKINLVKTITDDEARSKLVSEILLQYSNGIEPHEDWLHQSNPVGASPLFSI